MEQKQVRDAGYPLSLRREDVAAEHSSLKDRTGLVPRRMHEARLAMAHAAGMDPIELPFVAELMDLAPGEGDWRKAAEAVLFSVARIMLVDARQRDHLSHVIDPVRIGLRVNFEGVDLREHVDATGDSRYISGKLLYKDSPFSAWVVDRVRRRGTDALCVDGPDQLRGDGQRITRKSGPGGRGAGAGAALRQHRHGKTLLIRPR